MLKKSPLRISNGARLCSTRYLNKLVVLGKLQRFSGNKPYNSEMRSIPACTPYLLCIPRSLARVGVRWLGGAVGQQEEAGEKQMNGPRPLVLCGPSGSGKSTLLKRLMAEFPDQIGFSVSHTTRKPRAGEENGKHYHFVERSEMEKAVERGEFVESATFSGNLYGTSKKAIQDVKVTGRVCVLDIDIQGVRNLKNTNLNPRYVFIKPPSLSVLEQRLRARGTESEEAITKRLDTAKTELSYAKQAGSFDVVIVNDDLEEAYNQLRAFILPELKQLQESSKKPTS